MKKIVLLAAIAVVLCTTGCVPMFANHGDSVGVTFVPLVRGN